jgi:peptidoglycan/xylan/chitin deacetylase (PgdA/CDA1 family)
VKRIAIYALVAVLLLPVCAQGIVYRQGEPGQGNPGQKKIAITVDDCENLAILAEMLDLFKEQEIKATFFVLGRALKVEDRELWQRMVEEGHEIGNHTYGHISLTAGTTDGSTTKSQLRRTENRLNEVLGYEYPMRIMRPPYGKCQINGAQTRIKNAGYDHIILWSVSQINPKKALGQIVDGSICLYHSNKKDLLCLQEIIPQLKEDGYEMVTVSELLGITSNLN